MSIKRTLLAAAVLSASFGAARADGMRPIEARSLDLGEVSGVAYYTVERDGFHVVTTLVQGESGTPVRYVTVLAPGQRVVLSAPRDSSIVPLTIEISRQADSLHVSTAPLTN